MARNTKRPMDTRSIPRPSQQKRSGPRFNAGNGPLPGHGPFAAKLAQMTLSDKCTSGSAQTTKHLWESCTKSERRRLHDTEPNITKILQDKDKRKEFQLLVKEIEKRLRDEEYQSKNRNAGNRSAR